MTNQKFNFVGGATGLWSVVKMEAIAGKPLERVEKVQVIAGELDHLAANSKWHLRGVTSYERYVTRRKRFAVCRSTSFKSSRRNLCRSDYD